MRYVILIYENESNPQPDEAEMGRWFGVTEEMQKAGVMVAGEALHPTSSATTVREKGGRYITTDGPFAETKEQLGGFYLIDVPDLDAALEWAKKMPNVGRGSMEVRPVVDFSQG
jgi:hypothetical protein